MPAPPPTAPRPRRAAAVAAVLALAAALLALPASPVALAGPAGRPLAWFALGDSYVAGVIAATGPVTAGAAGTGCARTEGSYPERLRRALGERVALTNVSCSGAAIEHVASEAHVPGGRPRPLGAEPPGFAPVPPQIEAVSADADVITVGVGGNDLALGEIFARCLALGDLVGNRGAPCREEFGAELPGRLAALRQEFDALLDALHRAAPDARIVTVGYPQVVPPDPAASCAFGEVEEFGTVTFGDLAWLGRDLLQPLNDAIEGATREHGGTFVDLYAPSAGHSVCAEDNWIDGLRSAHPPSWAVVHPNAEGHAHFAALLRGVLMAP